MAVTLTSTGITFSDGTTQNSAAAGAASGGQIFNASGTWSRSGAGDPNTAIVTVLGGGGGGSNRIQNYTNNVAEGGNGALAINQPLTVTGNVGVTVGNGGAGGSQSVRQAGNASTFQSITSNGGGVGWYGFQSESLRVNHGADGNTGGAIAVELRDNTGNKGRGGRSNSQAGQSGTVVVIW